MKKLVLATTAFIFLSGSVALAATKAYPLVGQVVELSANKITLQTANKKTWEVARDSNSKIPADVKVGSIVVLNFTATAVEAIDKTPKAVTAAGKAAPAAAKAAPAAAAAAAPAAAKQ